MLRRNVVARAISKWGRYGFGFALAVVSWLQPATARAVLMNYTGTFSISVEGFSASSQPFHGTADVNLATGAFRILSSVAATQVSTWGTWTISSVYISPPGVTHTTVSGTWISQGPYPIAQHPMLSVGGYSQGWVDFRGAFMAPAGWGAGTSPAKNFQFYPGGGLDGGFGGNGHFVLSAMGANFYGSPYGSGSSGYARSAWISGPMTGGVTTITSLWNGSGYLIGSAGSYFSAYRAGYNWTANNASFTIDGRLYTAPGSDNRNTTNRTGQILLVTPIRIYAGMPNGGIGGFFSLDLDFAPVPEPGTAVLLGAGLLSLALAGRSRRARN